MKTYKLIALCLASLFFGACEDGLDEEVGLQVSVATNENTSYDGQIVTVNNSYYPAIQTLYLSSVAKKDINISIANDPVLIPLN